MISAPPEIMPFHFSSNLKEGGITNIVCSVTSGDLPITFTWRKDGKPLPHDPDIREQQLVEMVSTLRINNLAAKHSGHYTCIATNPASSANFTAELVVRGNAQSILFLMEGGGRGEVKFLCFETTRKKCFIRT